MRTFDRAMTWIMVVSGLLTCTLIYAAFAPEAALQATFGESLTGPLAEAIVRNWGMLIFLVGAFLIYGAYHRASRVPALLMASGSKLTFIVIATRLGDPYMGKAILPVIIDTVMVAVFVAYVVASKRTQLPAES